MAKNVASLFCVLTFLIFYSAGFGQDSFISNGKIIQSDTFDRKVYKMMNDVGIPGVSLAIIENNKIVYHNAYGYKRALDSMKVDKNTVFEAASLSKTYLVYVAFKLVEEGKLALDTPLYRYLDFDQLHHDPRYKRITARMVLSHSSGLENWMSMNDPDTLEILSNPGEKFIYSGAGYNYLANVIKKILNAPYEIYVNRLVNKPLGLKRSFYVFSDNHRKLFHKYSPHNFSWGHDIFGKSLGKWRNQEAVPSSANNVTAFDYAKLMLSFFDGKHFQNTSVRTILTPIAYTGDSIFKSYYGTGFEIFYPPGDTIIGHGGDNQGFKSQAFYSTVKKRGFVILTNSDNGKVIVPHLSFITAGLDISKYYDRNFPFHYPDNAMLLFKIYRENGDSSMIQEKDRIKHSGELGKYTLSTLGWFIMDKDTSRALKLFLENTVAYPDFADTYGFLGELYVRMENYHEALRSFLKAKSLNFHWWNNDEKIALCREKIDELNRRNAYVTVVPDTGAVIRSENYNWTKGSQSGKSRDIGGQQKVTYLNKGAWMDYVVDISKAGAYTFSIRIASPKPGNSMQLIVGNNILSTVSINVTKNWEDWTTIETHAILPSGRITLRLYGLSGDSGFNINWFKFKPITAK